MKATQWLRSKGSQSGMAILAAIVSAGIWVLFSSPVEQHDLTVASQLASRKPTGFPQLISIAPMPQAAGQMCQWVPVSSQTLLVSALRQRASESAGGGGSANEQRPDSELMDRAPVRVIKDSYPTYSGVAVDLAHNEIVLQDENLFQILVFDRLANTPPTASITEPKRVIGGKNTKVEFNCGIYVYPKNTEF